MKGDWIELVEIGPRMTLMLIRVADGAMSGESLYWNSNYVTPSNIRD
jgi:hypothetical protein